MKDTRDPRRDPRIAAAETLNHGLVLKFDDGRCAFYSSRLLYTVLPQAEELDDTKISW